MVRLLILSFVFFLGIQAMAADCGRFAVVKQPVTFKKQGNDKIKTARKNAKICQGDTIITGESGRAKIVMADKNEINVSPNSEIIIETYENGKKSVLNVLNGKVRSDVKNKYRDSKSSHYRVKTKSAVAGVRGTEFLTSYNAATNQSRVVTFEGEVAVGRMVGGNFVFKVIVKPGQFTSNSTKTDLHPAKEVPPAELAQMDRESKVADVEKAPASTPDNNRDKKKDSKKEDQKKAEPQPDSKDGDRSAKSPKGAKGPKRGVASVSPDGDIDMGLDDKPFEGGNDGERDIAQVDLNDALPPPSLEIGDVGPGPEIRIPHTTLTPGQLIPPNPTQDICGTSCNDAIINKQVKVTIIPRMPGQ